MVNTTIRVIAFAALTGALVCPPASAQNAGAPRSATPAGAPASLDQAHHLFYSGRYEASAALALEIRTQDPGNLAASELRTSALHFQIRRALGEPKDRGKAWKLCLVCQELMPVFLAELAVGRAAARAQLAADPEDVDTLFFLGKLDLNYVWLQLATAGRKTGLGEYREARKSLDTVLEQQPDHIRAQVARAWIDYIVDTRMPFGTKWILGGGDKDRGLRVVREASQAEAERYVHAEAKFAFWDMQVREKNFKEAVVTARALSKDFPDNAELVRFVAEHDPQASR
jgi:hypothetical protein